MLASTPSIRAGLHRAGIGQTHHWGRGVDLKLFRPDGPAHPAFAGLPGPILLHVGRVAVEKNIEAFLALDVPGSKVVVGDGPARTALQAKYPDAHFLGLLHGEVLASAYRGADCLVFPSRTDTFGLVMIEALASGTPVAAYPVMGPIDILDDKVGGMDEVLDSAVAQALTLDRADCAAFGRQFTWARSAREFLASLHILHAGAVARAADPEHLLSGPVCTKSTVATGRSVRGGPYYLRVILTDRRRPWPSHSCPTQPPAGWSTILRSAFADRRILRPPHSRGAGDRGRHGRHQIYRPRSGPRP